MLKRSAIACILLLALAGPVLAQPVDLELVLAADGSGSIDDDELRLQREGYAAALNDPRVLGAIRSGSHGAIAVAFVEWGGPTSVHTIVDWTLIRDAPSAEAWGDRLVAAPRAATGYNSISAAIDYGASLIRTNGYEGLRKVIDVSGDGPQIGGRPLEVSRSEAMLAGITINALVISGPGGNLRGPGGIPLELHYERDVIGGPGAFVVVAEDRTRFAQAILQKLVREIAGVDGPTRVAARDKIERKEVR